MKTIIMLILLSFFSAFAIEDIDLDVLWKIEFKAGSTPIGFSNDQTQILTWYNDSISHINANTGEILFSTFGWRVQIHPFENYYFTSYRTIIDVNSSHYRPFLVYRNIFTGEPFDTLWMPNDVGSNYGILNINFSPDGNKIAITGSYNDFDDPFNVDRKNLILIYDLTSKKAIQAINFHHGPSIYGPVWSKDNNYLYAVDQFNDHILNKIDIKTGKIVKNFEYKKDFKKYTINNAWSTENPNYLFVATFDYLNVYNNDDELIYRVRHNTWKQPEWHYSESCKFNEDKSIFVTYGRDILSSYDGYDHRSWDINTGEQLSNFWYVDRSIATEENSKILSISNKDFTKTLIAKRRSVDTKDSLLCVSNFWENPIVNNIISKKEDDRFSDYGNMIEVKTQTGDDHITIRNLLGSIIKTIAITQPNQLISINKLEFNSGTYFITVHSQTSSSTYKFNWGN